MIVSKETVTKRVQRPRVNFWASTQLLVIAILVWTLVYPEQSKSEPADDAYAEGLARILIPSQRAISSVPSTTPEEFSRVFPQDDSVEPILQPDAAWTPRALELNCLKAMSASAFLCNPASQMKAPNQQLPANENQLWSDRSPSYKRLGDSVIAKSLSYSGVARSVILTTTAAEIQRHITRDGDGAHAKCEAAYNAATTQMSNYQKLEISCDESQKNAASYCVAVLRFLREKLSDEEYLTKVLRLRSRLVGSIIMPGASGVLKSQIQSRVESMERKGRVFSQWGMSGVSEIRNTVAEFKDVQQKAQACMTATAQAAPPSLVAVEQPPPAPAPARAPPPAPAPAEVTTVHFDAAPTPAPVPVQTEVPLSPEGSGISPNKALIGAAVVVGGVGVAAVAGAFRKGSGGTPASQLASPGCQTAGTRYCQLPPDRITKLGMAIESVSLNNAELFNTAVDAVLTQNPQIAAQFNNVSYSGSVPGVSPSVADYANKERAYSYANRLGQLLEAQKVRAEDLMAAFKTSNPTIFNQIGSAFTP